MEYLNISVVVLLKIVRILRNLCDFFCFMACAISGGVIDCNQGCSKATNQILGGHYDQHPNPKRRCRSKGRQ